MKLHHVGVVVESIERLAPRYSEFLGLTAVSGVVTDETQKVNVQFLAEKDGETSVELIEPLPGASPVRRALEKGGGLNHLCFEVPDVAQAVREAESKGAICVRTPVAAAAFEGRPIAFVFFRGVGLIEFVEAPHAAAE